MKSKSIRERILELFAQGKTLEQVKTLLHQERPYSKTGRGYILKVIREARRA